MFLFLTVLATPDIYTLSLHDALPICIGHHDAVDVDETLVALLEPQEIVAGVVGALAQGDQEAGQVTRSEEHTSELQSRGHLVCRLLLEKKKNAQAASHS